MEIDRIKHQRDVELFGQSQEEIDKAAGKRRSLSYKLPFIIIASLIAIPYLHFEINMSDVMRATKNLFYIVGIISLALTSVVSYFEYKRLKEEYSKKDIQIWFDYLAPRILLYSFTIYAVIGVILSIYDQTNEKYVERDGTIKRFVKKENNLTTYIVEYKDEDGSLDSLEIWTWKDVDIKEGDREKVKYRLGGLGRKSNFH